jgi:hypothetical protein
LLLGADTNVSDGGLVAVCGTVCVHGPRNNSRSRT